jgi:hypothetical protein
VWDAAKHDLDIIFQLANDIGAPVNVDPVEEWEAVARELVSGCWAAISSVAAALCARGGRLSASEVAALVAEAPSCRA